MAFFPSLKHNFIVYRSSLCPDCIFEIYQLWQSGFSRVYSNCFCSCSFEAEIIKIGQSSYKIYRNSIMNCQESTRRGLPWGLPEVVGTVKQVHCRLLRRGLEFHVCTLNKSAHTKKKKKSGNLSYAPRIYLSQSAHIYLSIYLSMFVPLSFCSYRFITIYNVTNSPPIVEFQLLWNK